MSTLIQRCPVCDGTGLVSKPPGIAGDVTTWMSSSSGPYPCRVCAGAGILATAGCDTSRLIGVPTFGSLGDVVPGLAYQMAHSPAAAGPLRSLIEDIRSGVTELEVEVNRFELSRDASNDDVAKAVDDASAELVFTLARLRVAVREIANHAEHQFTTTGGEPSR
jgi:hypothetical protein